MAILVAFGSKRGGTEGLATWVADGLRQEGFMVDVIPARAAHDVDRDGGRYRGWSVVRLPLASRGPAVR